MLSRIIEVVFCETIDCYQDQWRMQQQLGAGTEEATDIFRETISDTNPWLLGLTAVISIFHMLFDFLAFRNDISFWKVRLSTSIAWLFGILMIHTRFQQRKSLEGLSVRTILVNCFFQLIILLYLFDNDTSWMILIRYEFIRSSPAGRCSD